MGAFTHIGQSSRFTDGSYGVYYAARELETAIRETAYHFGRFLRSTNEPLGTEMEMRVLVSSGVDEKFQHTAGLPGAAFARRLPPLPGLCQAAARDWLQWPRVHQRARAWPHVPRSLSGPRPFHARVRAPTCAITSTARASIAAFQFGQESWNPLKLTRARLPRGQVGPGGSRPYRGKACSRSCDEREASPQPALVALRVALQQRALACWRAHRHAGPVPCGLLVLWSLFTLAGATGPVGQRAGSPGSSVQRSDVGAAPVPDAADRALNTPSFSGSWSRPRAGGARDRARSAHQRCAAAPVGARPRSRYARLLSRARRAGARAPRDRVRLAWLWPLRAHRRVHACPIRRAAARAGRSHGPCAGRAARPLDGGRRRHCTRGSTPSASRIWCWPMSRACCTARHLSAITSTVRSRRSDGCARLAQLLSGSAKSLTSKLRKLEPDYVCRRTK